MILSSPAFETEDGIPARHTCDGADVSPALSIEDLPEGTRTLALVLEDPDAPAGTWDHWVAYDIPPSGAILEGAGAAGEGASPTGTEDAGPAGTPGTNSWGRLGYGGPCPPRGTHRYVLTVYALDVELGWEAGADKISLLEAIHDHVLADETLLGFYTRP